jgi:hypothetical protein
MNKVLAFAALAVLRGLAVMLLWNWYVVPFGVMAIGIFHGFGLALLGSVLTYDPITTGHIAAAEDDMEATDDPRLKKIRLTRIGISFLQPIAMIVLGFIFSFLI